MQINANARTGTSNIDRSLSVGTNLIFGIIFQAKCFNWIDTNVVSTKKHPEWQSNKSMNFSKQID